jgi:type IV fimbrial biogenesis protein FimT
MGMDERKEAGMNALKERQAGLSLVELSATMGLVAILAAIAFPGLGNMQRKAVRTVTINDFVHSIHLARNEAIKRNAVVSICRSADGKNCANQLPNWNGGWIVFENLDRDQPANTDAGETILYRRGAVTSGVLDSNRDSFSFRPFNQVDVNGTIVYCPTAVSKDARAIIISHTGRPRTSDKDAGGKPLKC